MKMLPLVRIKKEFSRTPLLFKGFTLIEMMVVMAIIASLASLFITSFPASQRRARDTKRRSDLKQYDALLREFGITHSGYYPGASGSGIAVGCTGICAGATLCNYLGLGNLCGPLDQYNNQAKCNNNQVCQYLYQGNNCNTGAACANSFVLRAHLENDAGWLVYCSNGVTGIVAESTNWTLLAGTCPI